jgi:hypothetical protein
MLEIVEDVELRGRLDRGEILRSTLAWDLRIAVERLEGGALHVFEAYWINIRDQLKIRLTDFEL